MLRRFIAETCSHFLRASIQNNKKRTHEDRRGNLHFVPVLGTVVARLAHGPHDVKPDTLPVLDILANGAPRTPLGRVVMGKVAAKAGLTYPHAAKSVAEFRDRGILAFGEQTLGGYRMTVLPKGRQLANTHGRRTKLAA